MAGAEEKSGAYRVLARKYRPASFEGLIGQEPMVRTLSNAFESGRIAQAWMLTGVRGIGKTTTARILARALNYLVPGKAEAPTVHMPETGVHCEAIMEGRHVDVIEMDAASHTGIADIREIIEQVRYRPVSARYKVYIIDEVHMLSTAAFNGLLKTLEEPPEHVKFIFATTEIRKVPVTVLSRCQRFDLRRIDADILVGYLDHIAKSEEVRIDEDALKLIARAAEGSVRDALSLLDQGIAHGGGEISADDVRAMLGLADRARVVDLFGSAMKGDLAGALAELGAQYDVGADPGVILSDLADYTHLVTRLKVAPEGAATAAITETELTRGKGFAEGLSLRVLSRTWQMLLKGIQEVNTAPKPLAAAEMVLVRLCHAADMPTPDEALRMLRDGGDPGAHGSATGPSGGRTTGTTAQAGGSSHAGASLTGRQGSSGQDSSGQGGAIRAVAGGGPRLVAERSEPVARQAIEAPQPEAPTVTLASLADVAALAKDKRDLRLKDAVENLMRPVSFTPGRIEITMLENAPHELAGDLGRKLSDWTGMRWLVIVAREGGGATIGEEIAAERRQRTDDARADPNVAAVLSTFPGAKIVDVRIFEDEEEFADDGILDADEAGLDTLDDMDALDLPEDD